MSLRAKADRALEILLAGIGAKPVLYCSFGKDSMVLLHLARSAGLDLPIAYHRHPVFPRKETFANQTIEDWQLRVHSYPPVGVQLSLDPHPEIINYYALKNHKTLLEPVGLAPEVPGENACGLELMRTIRCTVDYPWDSALFGQKASDRHFLFEDMTPREPIMELTPGLKFVYPIVEFTDADVWEYTETFGVPWNEKRYDRANGYAEFVDTAYNNDRYPTCVRCIVAGPQEVHCPKTGGKVPNVHAEMPLVKVEPLPNMKSYSVKS